MRRSTLSLIFSIILLCLSLLLGTCSLARAIDERIDTFEGIHINQPAECVLWAQQYAKTKFNCIIPPLGANGGARLIWEVTADHPSNSTQIADTAGALPAVDDIIVFNASVSPAGYGHVGIVAQVNSRTDVEIVDTNWHGGANYGLGYIHTISLNWSSVYGWFHENNNPNMPPGGGSVDPANPYVDGSYNGTQIGTAANPFKTVMQAVNAASATQATIHIKPGSYAEKVSTSKHILFVTWGTGTVRIGG